jgi:hypothetical protein
MRRPQQHPRIFCDGCHDWFDQPHILSNGRSVKIATFNINNVNKRLENLLWAGLRKLTKSA